MEKRSTSLSGPDVPSVPALRPAARTEVELKLLASPAAIERIRAASVIVQHARNRGVVRRLETVYYDTPDHALSRERSSLRVRRNGTRYVQTLKRRRADQSPFARDHWEAPVDTPAPDLTLLPAEIGGSLGAVAKDGVAPVFATRFRRRAQRFRLPGNPI